jgi:hypothetical protein
MANVDLMNLYTSLEGAHQPQNPQRPPKPTLEDTITALEQ